MNEISTTHTVTRLSHNDSIASGHDKASNAAVEKKPKGTTEMHNSAEKRANTTSYSTRNHVKPPSAEANAKKTPQGANTQHFDTDKGSSSSVHLKA